MKRRARDRIVEVLLGSEHASKVEFAGLKQGEVDRLHPAPPARIPRRPAARVVREQVLPRRVAAMVEGDGPVGDVGMAAGEALVGNDALGEERRQGTHLQIDPGQDVAGSVPEEDAVGPPPAPLGVSLDTRRRPVHQPRRPS
jgi:hypothetical protein